MPAMTERLQTLGEFHFRVETATLANQSFSNAGRGNAAPGVGGTAQDGGMSTADTVADGGPSGKKSDADFKP